MQTSLNRTAFSATLHCLTGCAVGEVLGMIISSALRWSAVPSIALAVTLAFTFGYVFSLFPLLKGGLPLKQAIGLALAADTVSNATMEIVDNGFLVLVPGAIHSELDSALFWISLILALTIAFFAAWPVNRYLIARGKGHALVHKHHHN